MTAALSPAEVRTGARLMRIYSVAAAHILWEEQAAEAALVADRLERPHGEDKALRAYITEARAAIAAVDAPSLPPHLEVA